MNHAIKAEKLCKTYKLYKKQIDRLKDTLLPFKKNHYHTRFNALDNVSFCVEKGQTVGIVGRNGSGKSTLLQIICGILQNSAGSIEVDGRISALLELGAGFNPEFSGRENVYLNASILGMKRDEVDLCLDDILKFADIGGFIDQPVKTYSSGMYVRLAFAVAINVNPDILIIDEALSVGDTLFQAKCYAKFREFQEKGVTILFVTHSTELISRYCNSAILLDMGHLLIQGSAKDVVDKYNRLLVDCAETEREVKKSIKVGGDSDPNENIFVDPNSEQPQKSFKGKNMVVTTNPNENRYGNGKAEVVDFGVRILGDTVQQSFVRGENYLFWVKVKFNTSMENPIVAYTIKDVKGFDITGTNTHFKDTETGHVEPGDTLVVEFEQKMMLNPGGYLLSFGCTGFEGGEYVVYDRRFDVISFEMVADQLSVGMFDLDSVVTVKRL